MVQIAKRAEGASGMTSYYKVLVISGLVLQLGTQGCKSSEAPAGNDDGGNLPSAVRHQPSSQAEMTRSDSAKIVRGWALIQERAQQIRRSSVGSDPTELRRELDRAASEIAAKVSRYDIEQMIQYSDDISSYNVNDSNRVISRLSGLVIAYVTDPKDRHGFLTRAQEWGVGAAGGVNWFSFVVGSIDLYHDSDSCKTLATIAVSNDRRDWVGDHWERPSVEALGLLRGYEPTPAIRAQLQDQLTSVIMSSKSNDHFVSQSTSRRRYLEATMASWQYAKELAEPERKDYLDFETRLWRAWALSRTGFRGIEGQYLDASKIFDWRKSDEVFLLRIFETLQSTNEEVTLAEFLAPRLSEKGKQRLEAISRGDSPWVSSVKRALERIQKKKELVTSPSSGPE